MQHSPLHFPIGFPERMRLIFGPQTDKALASLAEHPTTLRVNTLKSAGASAVHELQSLGFTLEKVPWYSDAYLLKNKSKRELTDTATYQRGEIYIQSLASMLPPLVLNPQPGDTVLDMTAAPGSKTSQMAAMMMRQGTLVANDNNKVRFFKLLHNMELLGVKGEDAFLTLRQEHGAALSREYPATFDKILLDAPCSAEARFIAGDVRTFGYWKTMKISEMADKQRILLIAAWKALKPGGTLVYSTCTFAPEENEVQIDKFLKKHPDARMLDIDLPQITKAPIVSAWKDKMLAQHVSTSFRVFPSRNIEGFFIAKIQKI